MKKDLDEAKKRLEEFDSKAMASVGELQKLVAKIHNKKKHHKKRKCKAKKSRAKKQAEKKQAEEKQSMLKDLDGDKLHVLILFFLYILQGIPLGLKSAIPLLLSNRNVPYKEQATYSISSYPFSMKILWAPLVDSVYISRFGRRKSWLVPVQYLIGKTVKKCTQ